MIIDLILDRKDGTPWNVYNFYDSVMKYEWGNENGLYPIATALDSGTEDQARKALCNYIIDNGYDPNLCDYIHSKQWTA